MKPAELQHSGMHLIADLHGVDPATLSDAAAIDALLRDAATVAGATIIYGHFHAFGPGQGITGVLLLAESHISIHTWPEWRFAALDIFMCGDARPYLAWEAIKAALAPAACDVQPIQRGLSLAAP